ncbi:MAG: AMP-binding protein, partial [Deltaproteobacteria bacterium]|nr:AMP-binding protein [Deltaproteobacteria bacterium]
MVENQNLMRRLTISDWIAKSAAKTPNKVAYIYSLKGITTHQLTYRELVSKANHLANAFLKLGVSKGDRIAILSHNCPQFAVYLLAIAKIGAWITPLNFALKGKEIVEIIEHAEPSVFIVEDVLIDRILELHFTKQTIKEHIMINLKGDILLPKGWINFDEMWSEKESILEPTVDIAGSDVLNMIYTSGTEAMPKAVMNTHDNWNAAMITGFVDLHMTADTVTLISVPMYHVAGMHLMYNTLVTGGTVIMHYEPDVNEIVDLISNQKVNFIAYPPTVFVSLLKAPIPDAEAFVQKTLSNIRYAIVFGSPLPEAYINKLNNLLP